jgi:hypothetical protein
MPLEIEPMSIDQLAGAVVLFLGAVGSLLLVVWQSRCHCRVNLCYIFTCERRPPTEEEMKTIKDKAKELKDKKQDKILKKEGEILKEEEKIEKDIESLIPKSSKEESPKLKFDIQEKDNLM